MRTRLLFSLALLVCAHPLVARADAPPPPPPQAAAPTPEAVAEAARQTELGRQAVKAKRYVQAALLYEASAALGRHPSGHFSAALAWEQAERPERAADAYARAVAVEGLSAPEASQAKERLDTLEKMLGTLDVKAPPGWTGQLDAGTEAAVPARLHGTAGIHQLAVAVPDKSVLRRDVRLETGKVLALALKDEPSPSSGDAKKTDTPAPQAPMRVVSVEAPQGPHTRRVIGFGLMGLGAASLGAALILGLETIDARNAFNASPSRPLYDHEQTLQTWTNVSLIAGSVLFVGGATLAIWPAGGGEARVGLAPTPGGARLVGRF